MQMGAIFMPKNQIVFSTKGREKYSVFFSAYYLLAQKYKNESEVVENGKGKCSMEGNVCRYREDDCRADPQGRICRFYNYICKLESVYG